MRRPATAVALLHCGLALAQVRMDGDVRFVGPDGERRIDGLASPLDETAAIPVSVLASGTVHWAEASLESGSLRLVLDPPVILVDDGLLIRFLSPVTNDGPMAITAVGATAIPLVRTDGSPLPGNALRAGTVAEVLFEDGRWILLNPSSKTCPPGTVTTAGPTCMDASAFQGLRFYEAIEHCAARGGKLCTWDEYAVGCALRQAELSGLFVEWEWIDDTSNHTHTANQAGRFTCQSQRSANVIVTMTGNTRCCYRTR